MIRQKNKYTLYDKTSHTVCKEQYSISKEPYIVLQRALSCIKGALFIKGNMNNTQRDIYYTTIGCIFNKQIDASYQPDSEIWAPPIHVKFGNNDYCHQEVAPSFDDTLRYAFCMYSIIIYLHNLKIM